MWQKAKDEFHFTEVFPFKTVTLCGFEIHSEVEHHDYVDVAERCSICDRLYHLTCSTVYDARQYVKDENDLNILNAALARTNSKQLRKAIEVRIRKISKSNTPPRTMGEALADADFMKSAGRAIHQARAAQAKKNKKLNLLQKAYD